MLYHIFYHRIDADGWASGALFRKLVELEKGSTFKLHGIDYGDDFNFSIINKEDKIMIGDFSFTLEHWKTLKEKGFPFENITWFDHHDRNYKILYEEMPELKNVPGVRDKDFSGCMLIYNNTELKNLYKDSKAIDYVHKWDTWKHNEDSLILNFTAGFLMFETNPESKEGYDFWHKVFFNYDAKFFQEVSEAGSKVRNIYESQYKGERKRGTSILYKIKEEKYKLFVVNSSFGNSYLFGETIFKEHDACVAWRYEPRTGKIKGDVRSTTGKSNPVAVDCGGGGHPDASGFRLDIKTFFAKFINVDSFEIEERKKALNKRIVKDWKITDSYKKYEENLVVKKVVKKVIKLMVNNITTGNPWVWASTTWRGILVDWEKESKYLERRTMVYDKDLQSDVLYNKKDHGKLQRIDAQKVTYYFRLKMSYNEDLQQFEIKEN